MASVEAYPWLFAPFICNSEEPLVLRRRLYTATAANDISSLVNVVRAALFRSVVLKGIYARNLHLKQTADWAVRQQK